MRIDLNADVGERTGSAAGEEPALLRSVTSANIACGFHAGDPSQIRRTLRLVRDCHVVAGAHPSLADREGFGRRLLPVAPGEIEDLVLYQISALAGMARAESLALSHVKPHGALYHLASSDDAVADAVARAVSDYAEDLRLVGFAGSRLIEAGRRAGLRTSAEAFADRAYDSDGRLVPRDRPGAVLSDPRRVVEQALRIVVDGRVLASDGRTPLDVSADTLCIHGDTPGAAHLAEAVRTALEREGVQVAAPERQGAGGASAVSPPDR